MSTFNNQTDALQLLLDGFRSETLRTNRGDSVGRSQTRLEQAMSRNLAARDTAIAIRETIASQREIEVLQFKAEQKRQEELRAEQARQAKAVNGLLNIADSRFLPNATSEERDALRNTPFGLAWREEAIKDIIAEESAKVDLTNLEDSQQLLADLSAAQGFAQVQRRAQVDDETFNEVQGSNGFQEAYRNQNDSALNPISFGRNLLGSVIRGGTGLADLGITAASLGVLGGVGDAISGAGESIGEFVDDTNTGTEVARLRRSQAAAANPDRTFLQGIRDGVSTLNPGATADLVSTLGGILAGGGAVGAGARAVGRAAGSAGGRAAAAAEAVTPAARVLNRGGTPALGVGAGLDFAGSAVDPDGFGGDRFQQAITQLAGTAGLGALAGSATRLAPFIGGIEASAAQGGLRGVLGGQLRPASQLRGVQPGSTLRNAGINVADRAIAGVGSAASRGFSEANQEFLEGLVSQGAASVGNNRNEFNAGQLGEQFGLGGVIGAGLGAGRAGTLRPGDVDPAAATVDGAAVLGTGFELQGDPIVTSPPRRGIPAVDDAVPTPALLARPGAQAAAQRNINDIGVNGLPASQVFGGGPSPGAAGVAGPPSTPPGGGGSGGGVTVNTDPSGATQVQVQSQTQAPSAAPPPQTFQESGINQAQQTLQERVAQFGAPSQGEVAAAPVVPDIQPDSAFTVGDNSLAVPVGQPTTPARRSLAAIRRDQQPATAALPAPSGLGALTGQQVTNLPNSLLPPGLQNRGAPPLPTSAPSRLPNLVDGAQSAPAGSTPVAPEVAPDLSGDSVPAAPQVSLTNREQDYVAQLSNGPVSREALQSGLGLAGRGPVSRMVNVLRSKGVVDEDVDGNITLTDSGRELAPAPVVAQRGADSPLVGDFDFLEGADRTQPAPAPSFGVEPAAATGSSSGSSVEPVVEPQESQIPLEETSEPVRSNESPSASTPTETTGFGSQPIDLQIQQAFESGNLNQGRALGAQRIASSNGEITADDVVAEFEQLYEDGTASQADSLFEYLENIERGRAPESTDNRQRDDFSEAEVRSFLLEGNAPDAITAARSLYNRGDLTIDEVIDQASISNIDPDVRTRYIDRVSQFPRRQEADAGRGLAQLEQDVVDAQASLEAFNRNGGTEEEIQAATDRLAQAEAARDAVLDEPTADADPGLSSLSNELQELVDSQEGGGLGEPQAAALRPSPSQSDDDASTLNDLSLPDIAGLDPDAELDSFYDDDALGGFNEPRLSRKEVTDPVLITQEGGGVRKRTPLTPLAIRQIVSDKAGSFNVKVISDPNELTTEFRNLLLRDTAYEWDDRLEAVIYNDTIYLNQNAITDPAQLEAIMAHEVLGHAGLRARHGPQLSQFLTEIVDDSGGLEGLLETADRLGLPTRTNYRRLIDRANGQTGIGPDHHAVAEEVLVAQIEADGLTPVQSNIVNRMGAAIRQWLRRKFPRLAKAVGADRIADWELVVYARDASRAGRRILDQGRPVNVPRAYASRTDPWHKRVYESIDSRTAAAREVARNVYRSDAPVGETLAGLGPNVRTKLSDIRRGSGLGRKENSYNKFYRNFINNLRPLQNTTREMRRDFTALPDADKFDIVENLGRRAINSGRVKYSGQQATKAREQGLLRRFTDQFFGPATTPEARALVMEDKVDLYQIQQLASAEAELDHVNATRVLDGDLRASLSLLAQAGERYTSQADAYEAADTFIRMAHGMERNEAFFWDYRQNSNWKKWLGKDSDAMKRVAQIRAQVYSKGSDALDPRVAFRQEKQILARALRESEQDVRDRAQQYRFEDLRTTGPESNTSQLRENLRKMNFNKGERRALANVNRVLQQYRDLDLEKKRDATGDAREFEDQINRYGWKYYAPQWTEFKGPKDDEHMIGQGVYDPMMTTHARARGQTQESVSPIAGILHMVNRTYHDAADNGVTGDVIGLWAATQNSKGANALSKEWANGGLELIDKRTKAYAKLMSRRQPNKFIHHLSDRSPAMDAAGGNRGAYNAALPDSPSNYVMVLTYKGKGKKNASPIPELVKGRKQRSKTLDALRDSDAFAARFLSGGARTVGMFHTKYNPKFYLTNLLRETIAAFATVGAHTGLEGAGKFSRDSMATATRLMPKFGQYLYYQGLSGKEAQAEIDKLEADPEMKDFLEFMGSGAPTQFARSLTLNSRMDDLARNLRSRGLTPDANLKVQEIDRIIGTLPHVTDIVGRYAAYRTFRKQNYSKQNAASETRQIADFAQTGESAWADAGSMGYMFFRSGMVGVGQIADLFLDSKFNFEASGLAAASATAMFAAAYGLSGDDDDGNNLFLTQGNSTTHFKVFLGNDWVFQVPYSYNPFTAIGAATVQGLYAATGNQSYTEAATNMLDIATNNLTPVSNNIPLTDRQGNLSLDQAIKKFGTLGMPTLVEPLYMLGMNVNNFGAPIVPAGGSISDPGSFGALFNTPGNEIGGLAEDISRGLFGSTAMGPDVRRLSFLLGEYFNGPKFTYDSAQEWQRIATADDYDANKKRASFIFSGIIGTPHNRRRDRYHQLWARLDDIDRSRRSLIRAGYTESQAEQFISRSVGADTLRDVERFDELNGRAKDLGKEMANYRYESLLTDAERITRYNDLKRQYDTEVSRVVRTIEGR